MLIAGCPASGRDWVIKQWVAHLKRAAEYADQALYIFCVVPEWDEKTSDALQEACMSRDVELFLHRSEEEQRNDVRDWITPGRYNRMVEVRNLMLSKVRLLEPDLFLSIDSDILIRRPVIANLIETIEKHEWDAVGGKVWLSPSHEDDPLRGIHTVNYAKLTGQANMHRVDSKGVFRTDILMALKLMTPNAYWVDYKYDSRGEDIGWSLNAKEAGLKLGWDGRVSSKHIMEEKDLHRIDERVGW